MQGKRGRWGERRGEEREGGREREKQGGSLLCTSVKNMFGKIMWLLGFFSPSALKFYTNSHVSFNTSACILRCVFKA